jgi:hypothetical protein
MVGSESAISLGQVRVQLQRVFNRSEGLAGSLEPAEAKPVKAPVHPAKADERKRESGIRPDGLPVQVDCPVPIPFPINPPSRSARPMVIFGPEKELRCF